MDTVKKTANNNLCISCGICKAVCPKNCIELNNRKGLKVPIIDKDKCVNCGICYKVCPGKGFDYTKFLEPTKNISFWFGKYRAIYSAWTKDEKRRNNAVSGGVVTELVFNLLENGEYESAFLIGTHEYLKDAVCTKRFTKKETLENTQKSRYLPVSQEKAVSYMLLHRDEKLVLVGTGCFVEGIMNVISTYQLDRKNYFIIGLFCDKTMSFHVLDYFNKHSALKGKALKTLFFRTKEVGGWPGGVMMETESDEVVKLSNTERMKAKDYFQPERCMYCLDKLNMFADISVGDNYTGKDSDSKGSNSVIIRTEQAEMIWEKYKHSFEYELSSEEAVRKSQHLKNRMDNYRYAVIKEKSIKDKINITDNLISESKVTLKSKIKYRIKKNKISVGEKYNQCPWVLSVCLLWKNVKITIKKMMKGSSKCL